MTLSCCYETTMSAVAELVPPIANRETHMSHMQMFELLRYVTI